MNRPDVDFAKIRSLDGSQHNAFEEFCCQLARRDHEVPNGSRFFRYRGAGGDGGVECVWKLVNDDEWGWQAKYIATLKPDQIKASFITALSLHSRLTKYTVCVPFDLTGPTGRRGRSGAEAFEDLASQLEGIAKHQKREVEIVRWGKSELLDELLKQSDALIRLRFWFDTEVLPEGWFDEQVRAAANAAGPRYTPKPSIPTSVHDDLEAFGRTTAWRKSLTQRVRELDRQAKHWDDCCRRGDPFSDAPNELPESARTSAKRFGDSLRDARAALLNLYDGPDALSTARDAIGHAHEAGGTCLPLLVEALEQKHGAGAANSVGFRQFQAEYNVSLPAQYVDTARAVLTTLDSLQSWLACGAAELPSASAMLMSGVAGTGKTHTICDVALQRTENGLPSVVLLGEWFSHTTGEAWQRIASSLGFSAFSRDEFLSILNAAGETSGYPCVIFIDALNETVPRTFWRDSLATLIAYLSKYQWLRLCLTCRSSYIEEVIPSSITLPTVRHNGFAGIEFDACFEFFRHYSLEPPSMPLMQPEFANPLFLRLVCEALHDSGSTSMPEGLVGLREVVGLLFRAKNQRLSQQLDYDVREERVQKAVSAFVKTAAERQTRSLAWADAKAVVDAPWPTHERSKSLFDWLLNEGVLREERVGAGVDARDEVGIAFERLGDILLAEVWLNGLEASEVKAELSDGGRLLRAVDSSQGIAEALAIIIPERFGRELTSFAGYEPRILKAVIDSLVWRKSDSITPRTQALVRRALSTQATHAETLEALLAMATRSSSRLNANFFHWFVARLTLAARDGWLCPNLHHLYDERGGLSKLLRWALEADLSTVSDDTAGLWATMLTWFCLASDRRVRDHATKSLARMMEHHPTIIGPLLRRFAYVNDDYVVERCLAAAYGALLRIQHDETTGKVAAVVHEEFFTSEPSANVMIRDHARSIMELAYRRNVLVPTTTPASFRPPYRSAWPLSWPDEATVEAYSDSYRDLPKLYRSCFNDDFERYTVRSAISDYASGVDERAVLRWIFMHVLDLGYGQEQLVRFDRHLLSKYGGGRAHPSWAERIGKKYQWISFYRVLGHVKDNVRQDRNSWHPVPRSGIAPLQALTERNIDPSILLREGAGERETAWWASESYDFNAGAKLSDLDWLKVRDFPELLSMLSVRDPATQREFFVLQAYLDWSTRDPESDEHQDRYRHLYYQIRSCLVTQRNSARAWRWVQGKSFMNRWMPEGHDIHYGFLGEYPEGLPFDGAFSDEDEVDRRGGTPCRMYPTAYTVDCDNEFDAFQNGVSVFVPSPRLLRNPAIRWNGVDGYSMNGRTIIWDPSVREPGPKALLIDAEFFRQLLADQKLAIFWTALSEKQAITGFGDSPGWLEYSNVVRIRRGKLQTAEPFIKRCPPGDDE